MDAIVLADKKKEVLGAIASYSDALTNLPVEQLPQAYELTQAIQKYTEEVHDHTRDRILAEVKARGETVTDKGSKALGIGGYKTMAIPTKTGTDPKKLETLLRARKKDPTVAMDATVTYKVNEDKLLKAVADGILTPEDLKACAYNPGYRLSVERAAE